MPVGHRLLVRQLRRYLGVKPDEIPAELEAFLAAVDEAYRAADDDRVMIERTLELSSQELLERHARIQAVQEALEVAAEEARAASRAKSQFLASMSHELRTPLNAIIGYSELLLEDAEERGDAQTVDDVGRIYRAGAHLLSLINDILDLSKIEAGRMEVRIERFSLHGVVQEVASTAAPLVGKNGNALEVRCAETIGEMVSDGTKVKQVLLNLLSNAAKFTERGTVTLAVAEASQGNVTMAVRDTGIGMTPDQVDGLFQAFSQVHPDASTRFGGTGLGLAISRRYCTMLGGDIDVESEVGRGTTFTVWLPRAAPRPTVAEVVSSSS